MAVVPVMPYFGTTQKFTANSFIRVLRSGNIREYVEGVVVERWTMKFSNISYAEKTALQTFWLGVKNATTTAGRKFYFYDPDVVDAVDGTGASTTGRRTGFLESQELQFERAGRCNYNTSMDILVVVGG
jgi:hypothetical protein